MSTNVKRTITFGPRKVSRASGKRGMIYLPKEFSWLRGKKVMVTIEVLEEAEG